MKLTSGYAPPTFSKPCLVVDTVFVSVCRETAIKFVQALNVHHAYSFGGDHAPPQSEWIILTQHESEEDAITYHLTLVRPFKNGGSDEEWEEGLPAYLDIYEKYCPAAFRST